MTELKPCPFCGGKAELKTMAFKGQSNCWIMCTSCGASSQIFVRDTVQPRIKVSDPVFAPVVNAWNRRVDNEHTD